MASIVYTISLLKNGGADPSQDMAWEYPHIVEDGVVAINPSALLYHIFQGTGQGYTRVDDNGSGLVEFNPAGNYDIINHPPDDVTMVESRDIEAAVVRQVATGVAVLEDDDYIEIGADNIPGNLIVSSFKLVRIGIGNFL